MQKQSFVHLYTGNGKGKTTAAIGLALRAAGAGRRVFIAQFVKGMRYAEIAYIDRHIPTITTHRYGSACFVDHAPTVADIRRAAEGLYDVRSILQSGRYGLVILDEATIAVHYHLFTSADLIEAINLRHPSTEVVVTGRYATPDLIEIADLVTEMQEVKHYYNQGVASRPGIEC